MQKVLESLENLNHQQNRVGLVLPVTVCSSVALVVGPPLCRQGLVPPFILYRAFPTPPIACLAPWGKIVRLGRSGKPRTSRLSRTGGARGCQAHCLGFPSPRENMAGHWSHGHFSVIFLLLSLQGPSSPATCGSTQFSKHLLGRQAGQGDQLSWS